MDVKLTEAQKIKILNSDDVYSVMQKILLRQDKIDRNKEFFWTVGLDVKNQILYIELISLGGTSSTVVEPMQVFRVGVLKGAVKMILVHNHPSGELAPGTADKNITDRLLQVGNILQIEVIDHLIISEKSYLSFADTGLLEQINQSTKYVPNYVLHARLKREAEAIGEEKGEKKKAKEIARQMKKDGEPLEKIVLYTGLTEAEVKQLKR
jgi:DNA repair protein RadC